MHHFNYLFFTWPNIRWMLKWPFFRRQIFLMETKWGRKSKREPKSHHCFTVNEDVNRGDWDMGQNFFFFFFDGSKLLYRYKVSWWVLFMMLKHRSVQSKKMVTNIFLQTSSFFILKKEKKNKALSYNPSWYFVVCTMTVF